MQIAMRLSAGLTFSLCDVNNLSFGIQFRVGENEFMLILSVIYQFCKVSISNPVINLCYCFACFDTKMFR